MKSKKITLLFSLVCSMSVSFASSADTSTNESNILRPSSSREQFKKVLSKQKKIINLSEISSFDHSALELLSKYTFIDIDSLKEYSQASLYVNGTEIIFIPGSNSSAKIQTLLDSQAPSSARSLLARPSNLTSEDKTAQGIVTLTTTMGTLCESDTTETIQRKHSITSSTFEVASLADMITMTDQPTTFYRLSDKQKSNAGCSIALAKINIYLKAPEGLTGSLTRNVEVSYAGLMKSINDGGYIYNNGNNGSDASFRGFTDEIRFVTGFKNGANWSLNTAMSSPLTEAYQNCTTDTNFGVSETSGWNLGGNASGEIAPDGNKLGVSVSGGYNSSRTVNSSSGITCNSPLFRVANGTVERDSYYYDAIFDNGNAKTFYSSLQLARIGSTDNPKNQSAVAYNTGNRSVESMIENLVAAQKSLDEKNRPQNPILDRVPDTPMWPFTTSNAHKPFYNTPSHLVPTVVRNGFKHNAVMTYVQPYSADSNRYELISPRVETWYNPGYKANYISRLGYDFGLEFIIGDNLTKKVIFNLPRVNIDWLDQRFTSVKTMGIESFNGSNTFISRNNGENFEVRSLPYNSTDFAKPFPITDQSHVFYMTNLISADAKDKFQAFEINTYTINGNGALTKMCLGVSNNNNPAIMDCAQGGPFSKTIWRYRTTSYINTTEPSYQRSDFTICLRDKEDSNVNQCLANIDHRLSIHDYADKDIGQTRFQWNLVDLAAAKINYRNYYKQDAI